LPISKNSQDILASADVFIESFKTEKIGIAGIALKAGRAKAEDKIEPTAGFEFYKKIGDPVKKGEKLFTIFGNDSNLFKFASELLNDSAVISLQKAKPMDLIVKTLV
jgi:pyrimidine-nucleoside phosphorylase